MYFCLLCVRQLLSQSYPFDEIDEDGNSTHAISHLVLFLLWGEKDAPASLTNERIVQVFGRGSGTDGNDALTLYKCLQVSSMFVAIAAMLLAV